jgi:hypothetical protein
VLISTYCPNCNTAYQVQEELRGKPIRCQEVTCRHVFLVSEAAAPKPPSSLPPPGSMNPAQQTGNVGDLVPLLPSASNVLDLVPLAPAEPANPESVYLEVVPEEEAQLLEIAADESGLLEVVPEQQSPAPPVAPVGQVSDWRDAPPVRREAPPEQQPSPAEPPSLELVTTESGAWPAPPVRRPPAEKKPSRSRRSRGSSDQLEVMEEETAAEESTSPEPYDLPPRRRGHLAGWVILGGSVLVMMFLAAGGYLVYLHIAQAEQRLARQADEEYDNSAFGAAASHYEDLASRFKDSEHNDRYRFRASLAQLRNDAKSGGDVVDLLNRFKEFIGEHRKSPLLGEHASDVGESLVVVSRAFSERAKTDPGSGKPLEVVKLAREVLNRAKEIKAPKGQKVKPVKWEEAEAGFDEVERAVARWKELQRVLAELAAQGARPSFDAIVKVEEILERNAEQFPELARSPQVVRLIDDLFEGHLRSVQYVKVTPKKLKFEAEEEEPAILFDPLIQGTPGDSKGGDIVLALARGVLYALDQTTGRARWAMRVGIDTTALPVRIPAQAGSRERILVLSSDTKRLTALDRDGNPLWRYQLESPSLGRPVVIGERAFLPTLEGEVHEIELIEGKLLGRYLIGQRLTLGGTRLPGTNRVFFPADDGCVYVLNVATQKCEAILYSRHPSGSLRGEAILVGPEGEQAPGHLILTQSAGLRGIQLRVFNLPINRESRAQRIEPEPRLEGWTWFRPYHDPEKLVLLSDASVLGLFGIRQRKNRDQILFPLLPGGGLPLSKLLDADPGARKDALDKEADSPAEPRRGRAEVAQLQGEEMWVLAANQLQRLRLAWDPDRGPRLIPAWSKPLHLGSPLHASQHIEDSAGRTGLVVVTQPPRRANVWATSVDDESGSIRWRRQLGLVCEREPVRLAEPGQPPLLLVIDQGGALFTLDPVRYRVRPGDEWLSDSKPVRLAEALDENPDQPPLVIPSADGQSAYVIASPGDGKELVVRHVKVVAGERKLEVSESKTTLPAPLAGTPAIVGGHLVLPLADENLARLPFPFPDGADSRSGPAWLAERAPPGARGHVLALGGDRFLTTDGLRQLRVWEWPAKGLWQPLPKGRDDRPTLELEDRIVTAPIRLPGKEDGPVRIGVAGAGGKVTLVELRDNGALVVRRTWDVGGTITRGPFVQVVSGKTRLGCLVDRNRLVWLDPDRAGPLWSYRTPDGEALVGRPQLAAGVVVLADAAGRYVGLDPATGKPAGKPYQLKGSIAPVCSPVAFHTDRLLAPLSDGTLLLLGVKRLAQ